MPDLAPVNARLRALLAPYRDDLVVTADSDEWLMLGFARDDPRAFAAGVRLGKSYVSYHLMPVYAFPQLLDEVTPELRRRMQGKSCFNFTRIDEQLFAELEALTRASVEAYRGLRSRSPAG